VRVQLRTAFDFTISDAAFNEQWPCANRTTIVSEALQVWPQWSSSSLPLIGQVIDRERLFDMNLCTIPEPLSASDCECIVEDILQRPSPFYQYEFLLRATS